MITIWHLFSAICLFASAVSAAETAKSQHASPSAYVTCLLAGILIGVIVALANLSCARLAQQALRNAGQPKKVALLLLLFVASVGWIMLSDASGRWASNAILYAFLHK
jgi:nitrate reductase gamma subunit